MNAHSSVMRIIAIVALLSACSASVTPGPSEEDAGVEDVVVEVDTRCLDETGTLRGEEWVCERLTGARVQCEIGGRSDASITTYDGCVAAAGLWVWRDVIVLCDGVEPGCAGNVGIGGYFGACDVGPLDECSGREL